MNFIIDICTKFPLLKHQETSMQRDFTDGGMIILLLN
jgi:hypothetical protein